MAANDRDRLKLKEALTPIWNREMGQRLRLVRMLALRRHVGKTSSKKHQKHVLKSPRSERRSQSIRPPGRTAEEQRAIEDYRRHEHALSLPLPKRGG